MLSGILENDINSLEGLDRISYLLNNLFFSYSFAGTCVGEFEYQHVIDFYNRLLLELNQISDISSLLESYPSPDELKDEIESSQEIVQSLYYEEEKYHITDEKINEMKDLLESLINAVYAEIGNRFCNDE